MKKLFTIFLLGGLLLYSVGFYLVYQFNLHEVKQQMRASITSGEYKVQQQVQLYFDLADPSSIKNVVVKEKGKEIEFKGRMYDVIAVAVIGTKIRLSCIEDKNETNAIAAFTKFMASGDHDLMGKKPLKQVKYSFPVFTLAEMPVMDQKDWQLSSATYRAYHSAFIPIPYFNIPSPPPWQA